MVGDDTNAWLADAIAALGTLGPSAKAALPALRSRLALETNNALRRISIIAALTRIDREEIAACRPVILDVLKKQRWRTDSEAMLLAIEWGAEAKPLAGTIREMVTKEHVDLRAQLAAAIWLVVVGGDPDGAGIKAIRDVIGSPEEDYGRYQLLELLTASAQWPSPSRPNCGRCSKTANWERERRQCSRNLGLLTTDDVQAAATHRSRLRPSAAEQLALASRGGELLVALNWCVATW